MFAAAEPNPNFRLLDRFLLFMNRQQVNTIICFNKIDLIELGMENRFKEIFGKSGCPVICTCALQTDGLNEILSMLQGKITVFAGPSGVGKSSLLNAFIPEADVKTGDISKKIKRGKHTTRHSELMKAGVDTYIIDTPGFSTLYLDSFTKDELKTYYPEFEPYENHCRFLGCSHTHEPDCAVKQAVKEQEISELRYKNYLEFYEELKEQERHLY